MQVKQISVKEIKPYEDNPRYNDEAVQYVKESIKQFGFKVPLVISEDGIIVTGHTRYKASLELGLETIPCIIADDLTEEQISAFRIADNKVGEISEWDEGLLLEELKALEEFNFEDFGFTEYELKALENSFDVDDFGDLDDYEEPEKTYLKCPHCDHEALKAEFKQIVK